MTMPSYKKAAQDLSALMVANQIAIVSTFVPLSNVSKERRESWGDRLCLNWRCTLQVRGRDVITFDYSQGMGHAPSAKFPNRPGIERDRKRAAERHEAETGRVARFDWSGTRNPSSGKAIEPPKEVDVFHSLAMDSSVLDSGGFDNWAAELGMDTDSRKAESTYRECLEHALKLQAAIGAKLLQECRELAYEM